LLSYVSVACKAKTLPGLRVKGVAARSGNAVSKRCPRVAAKTRVTHFAPR
jgi:hypothetical protein